MLICRIAMLTGSPCRQNRHQEVRTVNAIVKHIRRLHPNDNSLMLLFFAATASIFFEVGFHRTSRLDVRSLLFISVRMYFRIACLPVCAVCWAACLNRAVHYVIRKCVFECRYGYIPTDNLQGNPDSSSLCLLFCICAPVVGEVECGYGCGICLPLKGTVRNTQK